MSQSAPDICLPGAMNAIVKTLSVLIGFDRKFYLCQNVSVLVFNIKNIQIEVRAPGFEPNRMQIIATTELFKSMDVFWGPENNC